ncbi:MAG: FAD-binding oxidoreductase [Gammaproteobacteria bacterium]|nr:FAD-binding oxidoreductase [Gammaproteobacteria bacterium]
MMTGIKSEVVVIGAGVAGISAALELSKTHKVIILEKKYLFSGSSGRNPGRMGHGFHYIDYETAKLYLEASIQVQRIYPHFLIGEHLPFTDPIRHGRYYVTKDSLYSFDEILATYRKLQRRYEELVLEDPQNKVFGEPESFFRILGEHEYPYVNRDLIVGGVETCEHLFNWQAFSLHIRQVILSNSNIRLMENCEVVDLTHYQEHDSRFKLKVSTRHGENIDINTNFIINSAWENIEELNAKLGIEYIDGQRTNRLKCLVEVRLPPSLLDVNSSFFCMGPFCMFSNMGDGRGMITLADVTNMEVSSSRKISSEMVRFVNGDVSQAEKQDIAREIQIGVARYIPEMMAAEILDVKFGIVQTKGEMSLQDLRHREGQHHLRNYHHIREEMQGLISNPAMKLFYFVQNGIEVRKIFDTQEARDRLNFLSMPTQLTKPQAQHMERHKYFLPPVVVQEPVPVIRRMPIGEEHPQQTGTSQNSFFEEPLRHISVCFMRILTYPILIGFPFRRVSPLPRASVFEPTQQDSEQLDPLSILLAR